MRTLYGASKEQRIAARYIPKGAARVALKDGSATVYLYGAAGKLFAIGYRGTAARSEFHYSYRNEVSRRQAVEQFFASAQASTVRKAAARADKAAWVNPLTVGDVLHTSWGYDQTNVEFFVVTRVSGRRVWVAEIAQDGEQTGFMSGRCWPAMPIRIVGEETMHIAQPSGSSGVYVKIDNVRHAWPEQGRAHGFSTYA